MATAVVSRKRKATDDVPEVVGGVGGRIAKSRKTTAVARGPTRKQCKSEAKQESIVASNREQRTDTRQTDPMSNRRDKRQRSPELVETPRHKRVKDSIPPTPQETPTRGASKLFDRLNLVNTESVKLTSKHLQAYQSPPETPHPHALGATEDTLPSELAVIQHQFTAFLNAQALFVAHHGAGSPCYLPELISRVTQTWKKRAVTSDDIRRLLGILGESSPFTLVDNGEGMICLELREGQTAVALQTARLTQEFARRLQRRWLRWQSTSDNPGSSISTFLATLPLLQIVTSEVARDPTKQTKGAFRLAQLKDRPAEASSPALVRKVETVPEQAKTNAGIVSRGASLLDRILAKQAATAAAPGGPTKEQLERLAALDRVEEVTRVLDFLAGGRPRVSFSMQAVVQHLQSSMRSPIGREEAERVVRVMADEVCPRYLTTLKTGGLYGVVVTKGGRPVDLRQKLDELRRL